MKRWHEEYARTYRQWRKHYLRHVERNIDWAKEPNKDPYKIDCVCDQQVGRFRKTDAFDCGRPRCKNCHGIKYPVRYATRQELIADIRFKQGLEEVRNGDN